MEFHDFFGVKKKTLKILTVLITWLRFVFFFFIEKEKKNLT
jgi:hypothetical protein